MADSRLPGLSLIATPGPTDVFGTRRVAATRDERTTRAQLHTLQSGEVITLDAGSAAAPSVGWINTGFYEVVDDTIGVSIGGVGRWSIAGDNFTSTTTSGARLARSGVSDTVPGHTFNGDADLGMGRRTTDIGVLIAGALNVMEFGEAGSAALMGFFGTAAVAKPTGVAVTDAGIHAALVTLGLIAA